MTKSESAIMPPSLQGLVRLSHHRWLVPLVAELGQSGGDRFAVLSARLEVSGPSLRRVIAAARDADLVLANPGYGHPLRPEYLLAPWGENMAQECFEVVKAARACGWNELASRKWSLPILAAVLGGGERYTDILQALPTATPRAIANALAELTQTGCISRTLVDGHPPRPVYAIARAGRRLARAAVALAAVSATS